MIEGYREMWLMVMFDLPTNTKIERKRYSLFRKFLLTDGFEKMQFSVYSRYCPSQQHADVHIERVHGNLPSNGEIRIVQITEHQYEKMQIFLGKKTKNVAPAPRQLEMF